MTRDELNTEMVIKAVQTFNGNVSKIAQHFSMSRETLYKYIRTHPTVQQALEEARESMIDKAEHKLYDLIEEGNLTAIIFFLKTRGKTRGYVERQEVTGADGGAVTLRVVYEDKQSA